MNRKRVFPDTGVLLAMIVFPRDRTGLLSLTGEVLQLYEAGAFNLVIRPHLRLCSHRPAGHRVVQRLSGFPHLTGESLLERAQLTIKSLYGLLCVFGWRERK